VLAVANSPDVWELTDSKLQYTQSTDKLCGLFSEALCSLQDLSKFIEDKIEVVWLILVETFYLILWAYLDLQ
jgi:hypothetical protein